MNRHVKYYGDLDLRWDDDTGEWITLREIAVSWSENGRQLASFRVAAGFHHDLSSIPKVVPRWLFPKIGPHNMPATVHDWTYEGMTELTRAEADLLFLDGLRVMEVPWWRRLAMYAFVRAFAAPWWDDEPKV